MLQLLLFLNSTTSSHIYSTISMTINSEIIGVRHLTPSFAANGQLTITVHPHNLFQTVSFIYTTIYSLTHYKADMEHLEFIFKMYFYMLFSATTNVKRATEIFNVFSSIGCPPGLQALGRLINPISTIIIFGIISITVKVSDDWESECCASSALNKLRHALFAQLSFFARANFPFLPMKKIEQINFTVMGIFFQINACHVNSNVAGFDTPKSEKSFNRMHVINNVGQSNFALLYKYAILTPETYGTLYCLLFLPETKSLEMFQSIGNLISAFFKLNEYSHSDVVSDLENCLRWFFKHNAEYGSNIGVNSQTTPTGVETPVPKDLKDSVPKKGNQPKWQPRQQNNHKQQSRTPVSTIERAANFEKDKMLFNSVSLKNVPNLKDNKNKTIVPTVP